MEFGLNLKSWSSSGQWGVASNAWKLRKQWAEFWLKVWSFHLFCHLKELSSAVKLLFIRQSGYNRNYSRPDSFVKSLNKRCRKAVWYFLILKKRCRGSSQWLFYPNGTFKEMKYSVIPSMLETQICKQGILHICQLFFGKKICICLARKTQQYLPSAVCLKREILDKISGSGWRISWSHPKIVQASWNAIKSLFAHPGVNCLLNIV